ncbi:MAG TPA: QueG-associated DUF1730 domain-containing protein, partial [Longimicrobiaceae bacterium]
MISQAIEVAATIKEWARELGFDTVGIAPVGESAHGDAYARWVAAGHAGEMGYLTRPDAVEKRRDPRVLVAGAKTAVVVTRNYYPGEEDPPTPEDPGRGIFARYARNDDYHDLLKQRLIELQDRIAAELLPAGGRAYVDTGAVLERELAERAGL